MEKRYIQGLENVPAELSGCVLTIGNFDGVHLGHQRILSCARRLACDCGTAYVVAMTFEPSPAAVLNPGKVPLRLSVMHRRVERLLECGADYVVVANATPELLSLSAERFVDDIIVSRFAPCHMIEGPDFFYGANRSGNINTLAEAGKTRGFDVEIVQPYKIEYDGAVHVVSSTLIRELIRQGRIERAAECMGADFILAGEVVHGFGRGKALDFPTVNIRCPDQVIPADGVYAAVAIVDGKHIPAAVNVGYQPTFSESRYAVEAFLIDEHGDYYGKQIWLTFISRIRGQVKFENIDRLKQQISKDVELIKNLTKKLT